VIYFNNCFYYDDGGCGRLRTAVKDPESYNADLTLLETFSSPTEARAVLSGLKEGKVSILALKRRDKCDG